MLENLLFALVEYRRHTCFRPQVKERFGSFFAAYRKIPDACLVPLRNYLARTYRASRMAAAGERDH